MCLDTVNSKKKTPPKGKIVEGWKCFLGTTPANAPYLATYNRTTRIPIGKWVRAEKGTKSGLIKSLKQSYPCGFHVWATKDGAFAWGLWSKPRKVRVKGIHTIGWQEGRKVYVADWIFIP